MSDVRTNQIFSAKDVATFGVLASVALIFGYVEALFPLPIPVPGIKLGLGNIVILLALLRWGPKGAGALMLVKVGASTVLFAGTAVFFYSLAGGVVSLIAMSVLAHVRGIGIVGISMAGGVFHIVGQMLVVACLSPALVVAYLPILVLAGLISGFLTGYVCLLVVRSVGRTLFFTARRETAAAKKDDTCE